MVEDLEQDSFNIPDDLLDSIQHNIENIIRTFDVPEENKMEVIRRCFDNEFNKEFLRAQRYKNNLTLVMFDIDHFKQVNDTYGHQCGDYILKQVSKAALQTFRQTDTVYRTGGEEFMVILTETDINQCIIPLERFRKTIETLLLDFNNQNINITVSIGACQYSPDIKTKEELIEKADNALYKAKNSGRNQTVLNTCL